MKIAVRPILIHGNRRYMVTWKPDGGERERRYFPTKGAAETEAQQLALQRDTSGSVWLGLTAPQRQEIISVWSRAQELNVPLAQAVEFFHLNRPKKADVTAGVAYDEFILEREKALVSAKTLAALKSNVGRFIQPYRLVSLRSLERQHALKWLQRKEWGPRTFNSYLASLNTFFGWCVDLEYLDRSPTASIEKIDESRMDDLDAPPVILTIDQARALLKATWELDKGLIPYVAVGLFGGLRPDREAAKLPADDVRDGLICVRGSHAKDRQRRFVEIHPTLQAWLALGGDYRPKNLRRRFEKVRGKAGLIQITYKNAEKKTGKKIKHTGWVQDCLRHTFASNYLPAFGSEKTIKQLGHGDYEMLFGHYRALVTPAQAQEFWNLTPENVLQLPPAVELQKAA